MSRGMERRLARLERTLAPTTAASWRGRNLVEWPDSALWAHILGRDVSPEEAARLSAGPDVDAQLERIAGEGRDRSRNPSRASQARRARPGG